MSTNASTSAGSRVIEVDSNATDAPVAERLGRKLSGLDTSARSIVVRSFTYTSDVASVWPGSRLLATDWKATFDPSPETLGAPLPASPLVPPYEVEARTSDPESRSFTYTSSARSVSAASRFVENDENATVLPSADRLGAVSAPSPFPAVVAEANTICPVRRSFT